MEETDKQTAELLRYLQQAIEKGGEFVGEQAPLLAQEIVLYGRVWHTTCVAIAVIALVVLVVADIYYWRELWRLTKPHKDDSSLRSMDKEMGLGSVRKLSTHEF